jgi:hypothetical protein
MHVLFVKKINYIEIREKDNIKFWECPLHSVMHAFTLFVIYDMPDEEFWFLS